MVSLSAPATANGISTGVSATRLKNKSVLFWLCLLSVIGANVIWSQFDHYLPVWDQACHLINGLTCCDLLKHPAVFDLDWYRSLFTVSQLYPPLSYLVSGSLKAILGTQRWVDIVVHCLFLVCLFASTYGLSYLLFESSVVAAIASTLICIYPATFWMNHADLLDGPVVATIALSLFCFVRWQKYPSYRSASLFGFASGLAILTKHTALAFLAMPVVISLFHLTTPPHSKKFKELAMAGAITVLMVLPWLIFAGPTMYQTLTTIQSQNFRSDPFESACYYLELLPIECTPLLTGAFVVCLLLSNLSVHKKMFYVSSSAIGAFLLIISFRWVPSCRYLFPALIVVALYTAIGLVSQYLRGGALRRGLIACLVLLVAFQFVLSNFSPYPIPTKNLIERCEKAVGMGKSWSSCLRPGTPTVVPTRDLHARGDQWVMSVLKTNSTSERQNLMVMPNNEEVSASTYTYLAKKDNLNLDVFASRTWTMLGDSVNFDQNTAPYVKWYLLKTGDQGCSFCDEHSAAQYSAWCNYVATSGDFLLYGSKSLQDGSRLNLYHHK